MGIISPFEGGALLETQPQGDTSVPLQLPDDQAELLAGLLVSPEASAALADLYLAGVTAGERAVRGKDVSVAATAPDG